MRYDSWHLLGCAFVKSMISGASAVDMHRIRAAASMALLCRVPFRVHIRVQETLGAFVVALISELRMYLVSVLLRNGAAVVARQTPVTCIAYMCSFYARPCAVELISMQRDGVAAISSEVKP